MWQKDKDSAKRTGMGAYRDPMTDEPYEKLDDGSGTQIEDLKALVTSLRGQLNGRLPPDVDGKNGDRADWAQVAIDAFEAETGTERDCSLGDLLCDLMHWADRNNQDFDAALSRAQGHYRCETGEDEDA